MPLHTILQGDCLRLLRDMPDESVHCIVTSPPYWGLRDYGTDGQIGLEASLREHIDLIVEVFEECRRVLRKDGTLWLNYGDAYASSVNGRSAADTKATGKDDRAFRDKPLNTTRGSGLKSKDLMGLPWRIAFALQDAGWYLRSDIIWRKPNPMPESTRDRPTRAHEYVFLFSKRERYFYDADAIRTPVKDVTAKRLTQAGFDLQAGGGKDSLEGNRSHKKALNNQREKLIAAEKWGSRHLGGEEAKASMVGANARDVWDIGTEPFGAEFCTSCRTYFDGADKKLIRVERSDGGVVRHCPCGSTNSWLSHFATFPTELARRCIVAGSPTQCCSTCAAPYKRITDKRFIPQPDVSASKTARHDYQHDSLSRRDGSARGSVETTTHGFAPTCKCDADSVPSVVLDPFGGAGTVSLVATANGRRSILCELNPDYVELAQHRISRGSKKKPSAKSVRERKARAANGPDLVDLMATAPVATPKPTPPRAKSTRSDKQSGHGRRHAGFNARYFGVAAPEPPTIDLENYLATLPPERPTPTQRVRAERAKKGRVR